jgi:hypothetical protein
MLLGDREQAWKILQIHPDTQGIADATLPHALQYVAQIVCKLGKIKMAM